jgi:hypothetical protein
VLQTASLFPSLPVRWLFFPKNRNTLLVINAWFMYHYFCNPLELHPPARMANTDHAFFYPFTRNRPMKLFLSFLMMAFLLAGCIDLTINLPASPTGVPAAASPTPPEASATPTASPVPTRPTPTVDLTTIPPADSASRSLYFLAKSAVWVLRPNTGQAERMTAEETLVTAFDVWPEDGRLAYGTKSGKLYAILPGQDARLLVKLGSDAPYPAFINGVDWSPDGNSLAYTVDYESSGQQILANTPSRPSGLWVLSLQDGQSTWLMSNRYFQTGQDDVNTLRRLSDPQWSPDGKALLIRANYWENSNLHWLYPLQYAEDDRYLHSLALDGSKGPSGWTHASWTPDSQGLIFSGQENVTFGDLVYASRDSGQAEKWIDGKLGNLYVYDAYIVPNESFLPGATAGIASGPGRMIFLQSCPACTDIPWARLVVMKTKPIDPSMNGSILEPTKLCTRSDTYGNLNFPHRIEWQPNFSQGVMTCGSNEIYRINLHRQTPEVTDLLPALPALAPEEVPVFRWGER